MFVLNNKRHCFSWKCENTQPLIKEKVTNFSLVFPIFVSFYLFINSSLTTSLESIFSNSTFDWILLWGKRGITVCVLMTSQFYEHLGAANEINVVLKVSWHGHFLFSNKHKVANTTVNVFLLQRVNCTYQSISRKD